MRLKIVKPRSLLQSVRILNQVGSREVLCQYARPLVTQKSDPSGKNSTILEQSRIKFDSMLDRSTIYHLDQFAGSSPTPLSISSLLKQACNPSQEKSYKFLTSELPIRLANMIMELQLMPKALSAQPKFREIYFQYIQSFKDLLLTSSTDFNEENNEYFVNLLKEIRLRHIDTVPTMASAIQDMISEGGDERMADDTIQYCLNRI